MMIGRENRRKAWWKRTSVLVGGVLLLLYLVWPQSLMIPVQGGSSTDWNHKTFWYEPWGASLTHKGIDIFAKEGTPVVSPVYGIVVYAGTLGRGGNVVIVLTTQGRLHYFAHLRDTLMTTGQPVGRGQQLGTVGKTGNAATTPAHLHYSIVTLIPYPWRWDGATQGWMKTFFLDPTAELLEKQG